jgi:endogenous inhibitor of DNA gyrase (YacG/DUF329 family)
MMFWKRKHDKSRVGRLVDQHTKCPGCGEVFHKDPWLPAAFCSDECQRDNLTQALLGQGEIAKKARDEIYRLRGIVIGLEAELAEATKERSTELEQP